MQNAVVLFTTQELSTMAAAVAKSRMFPGIDNVEQAYALMLICQSEGIHPMRAMQRYHVIEGRPTWKAVALLAAFKDRGGNVFWAERTNTKVIGDFEKDGEKVRIEWNLEMAKVAGLATRGTWQKYPRDMLTSRVIREGVNLLDPAVSGGFYTTEEMQDILEDERLNPSSNTGKRVNRRKLGDPLNAQPVLPKPEGPVPDPAPDAHLQDAPPAARNDGAKEPQAPVSWVNEIRALIDKAADLATLDDVVKVQYKILIAGLSEPEREELKVAYVEKRRKIAFAGTGQPESLPTGSKELADLFIGKTLACKTRAQFKDVQKQVDDNLDRMENADILRVNEAGNLRLGEIMTLDPPPKEESKPMLNDLNADVSKEDREKLAARAHKDDPKPAESAAKKAPEPPAVAQEPAQARKSYREGDALPEWVKTGQKVSWSPSPGGKAAITGATITGPAVLDKRSTQYCVPIDKSQYPVMVSCLTPEGGDNGTNA